MIFKLADLNGENGFRLDGGEGYTGVGYSSGAVSNAGDVNGDGFDDVIIGAPNANSSFVVFGKASGFDRAMNLSELDGNNGFRMLGIDDSNHRELGSSVSTAGDINGDGFDDLIVSGYSRDPGASFVVFGKSSGFDATIDLANLDGNDGFRLNTTDLASYAVGLANDAVSAAGDVNGDGYDDLLVGDPDGGAISVSGGVTYSTSHGAAYVVFGKPSGFDAMVDLSEIDGNNGFRLDGSRNYDRLGLSVSNAGDVNGDGFDDVIIGAPQTASPIFNFVDNGVSYVVFGKANGFDATMDISELDGTNGFRIEGKEDSDRLGASVSSAGDVNGDGFDDLIIGAPWAGLKGPHDSLGYGSSYVVFGKASGFDAAMNVGDLNGTNGFRMGGRAADDHLGYSVSGAGDFNGDGFDDLIVGAPGVDSNGANSGSTYLVFGKASTFGPSLNLSTLDIKRGFRLDGENGNDLSGRSVSTAGDVNNDGFDDLAINAPGTEINGQKSGSSYIIFGRSEFGGSDVTHPGTPGNDNLIGTQAADVFDAGDGNDNMIGRGGADVFHAGAGDDNIRISDLNFQLIDGGAGNDTLHLAGKDLNLDLSTIGDKISGIETICLYGQGDNTLTLTAADLINLSDTTNTLKVHGNAGDHIVGLNSGWTDGGVGPNGYFHTYTQGDAILLVGANVTTDFALA